MAQGTVPSRTDDVSLMVITLEINPYIWDKHGMGAAFSIQAMVEQMIIFVNSYLLLHHQNQVAIITAGTEGCAYIFDSAASKQGPSNAQPAATNGSANGVSEEGERGIGSILASRIQRVVSEAEQKWKDGGSGGEPNRTTYLSGALSMALCYVQRCLRGPKPQPQPRMLCIHGSPDAPQQYIATMNAMFSAQKLQVPIDVCMIGGQDSAFLQQAAHLTGGLYQKPPRPEALLQYLLMVPAMDLHSRQFLLAPRPAGVDFRASCFCHKKTIDLGFVCSVCLSIFCQFSRECSTCGAVYTMARPTPAAGAKRKEPEA
ncbi:putative Transcription factor Tfb4 [Klebsormidium nitens]|uniref:General transcription and DNA repair factor IIH subunit TFB4 n=1 Tax=Klebsormidium nitens TaxID=105231 RepID=A0A1Y1I9V6_KLENI|nr:putative Transcription factor Tfb4 [Klebsormidium nitens]|eukprot:GAQ85476.1 putative Transcription factor Tfb4 [Klebsormidium nitens]